MKLSRFTDISSSLQLAQEPKPQPVKVCVSCPFEIDVILIFPTCRILGDCSACAMTVVLVSVLYKHVCECIDDPFATPVTDATLVSEVG